MLDSSGSSYARSGRVAPISPEGPPGLRRKATDTRTAVTSFLDRSCGDFTAHDDQQRLHRRLRARDFGRSDGTPVGRVEITASAPAREVAKVVALVGAGVAAFAVNQSIGVTLPVHIITEVEGTAADVGVVGASGTVGVIVGRLLSAAMVGRLGPAALGAASMLLTVVACLGYLFVLDDAVGLALIRALHGVAFAAATTALVVAMITAVRWLSRQRSMALANLAMPLSLAVSPVLAIEVLDASLERVVAGCAVISSMGAAGYLFVRKVTPDAPRLKPSAAASPSVRQLPVLLLVMAVLLGAADAAAMDYVPVLGTARDIEGYGWGFTVFAVGTATMLGLITAMRRVIPSTAMVVVGGVLTAAALAAWAWVGALAPLMAVMGTFGIGFAVAQTGVNILAAERSPAAQARALAGVLLAFDVGRAVGVYVIGLLIESFGFAAALVPLAVVLAAFSLAGGGRFGSDGECCMNR